MLYEMNYQYLVYHIHIINELPIYLLPSELQSSIGNRTL